jgi:hypothetical protein
MPQYKPEESYYDLDSYVSAMSRKKVKKEFDKFRVINKNTLYSGQNFSSPEVGDIAIDYDVVTPREIFLVGKITDREIIPFDNMLKIDPKTMYTRNKFIFNYKLRSVFELFMLILAQIALFFLILKNIQKNLKKGFLRLVPFLEDYFVHEKTLGLVFLMFLPSTAITLNSTILYYPLLVTMLLFAHLLRFTTIHHS